MATLHERTEKNLKTLTPETAKLARAFVEAANKRLPEGVEIRIIDGSRTFEEQDELFAQGRTKPGQIVTKAKGGQSLHNFGIAFDIGIFKDGKYLGESVLYDVVGDIGESVGLEWGGRWKSIQDKPHFQLKTGLSLAQLRNRKREGKPFN